MLDAKDKCHIDMLYCLQADSKITSRPFYKVHDEKSIKRACHTLQFKNIHTSIFSLKSARK